MNLVRRHRAPLPRVFVRILQLACLATLVVGPAVNRATADPLHDLQTRAVEERNADWGHWGANPERYAGWFQHSNRLIPIYTFGADLASVAGENSPYRDASRIEALYGRLPEGTLNPSAQYFDQTDVYRLQKAAAEAGKKYIVLVVFDGMDWQTTWAASVYQSADVPYRAGRGTGLLFQDYRGVKTDFGFFVTSPHNEGTRVDVDRQAVENPGGTIPGGYDWQRAGAVPWEAGNDPTYIIAGSRERRHAFTDSASSATSLTAGIKTYNNSVNVDHRGQPVETIAHELQRAGYAIGVVTSVPISHATPACAYAQNVARHDYQDLTRDLVGLPSVSHLGKPSPGVDVLIGAGSKEQLDKDPRQGENFVPGNRYITNDDLAAIDLQNGGRYRVVTRRDGQNGREALLEASRQAASEGTRLFGMFGAWGEGFGSSHLPFRTANGDYQPAIGNRGRAEEYSDADLHENPTLADMTAAALNVLEQSPDGFWLMVEAGDVDWANHDNNIDNSIGAVISGDEAFRVLVEWVEARDAWNETAIFLTADHGHYLVLTQPEVIATAASSGK